MIRAAIFVTVSVFLVCVSRRSFLRPRSHGFYRFFAFEAILALVLLNASRWFLDPFSARQIVSWSLFFVSVVLVVHGMYLLRVAGKPDQHRSDETLFAFEKTSVLVSSGIYKYIRHPLYSSLLFLVWGIFLKRLSWSGLLLAGFASCCLFFTAKNDESECLRHFGQEYRTYMQGTKRFIPFLF